MVDLKEFKRLLEVVKQLRDPENGCPWDIKQTHRSLLPFLIEEAYEYIHAVEENDFSKMEEEIGDVLLQVLLHCVMADEKNEFDIESSSKVLAEKLIRRHPHVFNKDWDEIDADGVKVQWEAIKKEERKDLKGSRIDTSYLAFPALFSANKIGKKTQKIGFDWNNPTEVLEVMESELQELKDEIASNTNKDKIQEELGDFLFSAAQFSRHLGFDPEDTLRQANRKFLRRFQLMEKLIEQDGKLPEDMTQTEMDEYWNKVKVQEK